MNNPYPIPASTKDLTFVNIIGRLDLTLNTLVVNVPDQNGRVMLYCEKHRAIFPLESSCQECANIKSGIAS